MGLERRWLYEGVVLRLWLRLGLRLWFYEGHKAPALRRGWHDAGVASALSKFGIRHRLASNGVEPSIDSWRLVRVGIKEGLA